MTFDEAMGFVPFYERATRSADGLLVTTDYVRDELVRPIVDVPADRFLVLPCGIDLDEFHPARAGDAARDLLADEGLRLRMAKEARQRAEDRFDTVQLAEELELWLGELLKESPVGQDKPRARIPYAPGTATRPDATTIETRGTPKR